MPSNARFAPVRLFPANSGITVWGAPTSAGTRLSASLRSIVRNSVRDRTRLSGELGEGMLPDEHSYRAPEGFSSESVELPPPNCQTAKSNPLERRANFVGSMKLLPPLGIVPEIQI